MSHIHTVIDTDPHYKIDGVTRTVVNVDETKRELVQGDHNSERFTFEIPRHVDGHDFSECNVVQVHYENVDIYEINKSNGIYNVEDLQVKNDDDEVVLLSWLISGNATKFVGSLSFVIRFACVSDGQVDYAWNTKKFKGISILEGLNNTDEVVTNNYDVIASLTARLNAIDSNGGSSDGSSSDSPGYYVVDETLTKQGVAADAAVTGQRMVRLSDQIAGNVTVGWNELEQLDEQALMTVLEAGRPVWVDNIQTVFDILIDGGTEYLTIDGMSYVIRKLGEVHDSLMIKDGALQLCHKINNTTGELRTDYAYENVSVSHLMNVIASVILPCSAEDLLAKKVTRVTYASCGAYLDGVRDDFEAMYRAHFIGNLCGCTVEQHGGTIYKACSEWLTINNHSVDLSTSTIIINEYNRYGYYWLSSASVWTLTDEVLTALRPQMKEYSNIWTAIDTGFPTNGLFVVTHPNAIVRWNNGEQTSEDRIEVVRHGCDGRVYSTVIDDAPNDADVKFHRYPETQVTFKGCTLNIDIAFSSVPMYFIRCERSNSIIRDFVINPTRRTTMNIGYRGAVFTLSKCADIIMENIKGVNIAGRPRDEYPRGVAGYILNATSILDLTVRDCNLLGYWGCVGLNGAKEITFDGCELNRVDIHDYFRNLTINNCRIYGQTINFGYGKGAVNITNCSVMTDWVHQIVNLRCDYGRYFEGTININNVDAVYTGPTYFDIVSGVTMFSAESAENTGLFMKRYPNINVSNVTLHLMKNSTSGYIFNMPTTLEDTIEITDKRKVVECSNVVAYDENGDVQNVGLCSLDGVVQSRMMTILGFADELRDLSTRLAAVEANGGGNTGGIVDYLYYSRRTLVFDGANINTRLTLPYEKAAAIYCVKCKLAGGDDVGVKITDWSIESNVYDGDTAYVRVPAGDNSTGGGGKAVIFAVYPGAASSGTYELTVERTAETDAYAGDIHVDFAAG